MSYNFTFEIQDPIGDDIRHDYCIPMLHRVIDGIQTNAKDERTSKYSKDKKKIVKLCAPTEFELKEFAEDIIDYYIRNFAINTVDYDIEIDFIIHVHKEFKNEDGSAKGKTINLNFINYINDMIRNSEYSIVDDKIHTIELQYVERLWKYDTKSVFSNQIRYTMAHEIYHVMHKMDLQHSDSKASFADQHAIPEIFAEYFAICYISDFLNGVVDKTDRAVAADLCGRARIYKDSTNNKNMPSRNLIENAKRFTRTDTQKLLQSEDYYGGELLAALAVKDCCENFGNKYDFYIELYNDYKEGNKNEALQKIIDRKGDM